jgi:hypothetical protein
LSEFLVDVELDDVLQQSFECKVYAVTLMQEPGTEVKTDKTIDLLAK